MTEQEFRTIYPSVLAWVQQTLRHHAPASRSVTSFGFQKLRKYYHAQTLANAKAVTVDRVPVPPLSAMGLGRFGDFERMDTYFLRADQAADEALHFHELVHVVQWRILGPESFLWLYADGLERFGYRDSPLEVIAYDLQGQFDAGHEPFEVEAEVGRRLADL
jgi:hypothetical protein